MKRITAAVLAIMLILCGCGQKTVVDNDNIVSDTESTVADTADKPSVSESSDTDSEKKSTDTSISKDTDTGKDTDKSKKKGSSDKDRNTDSEKSAKKNSDTDKKKSSGNDTDSSKNKAASSAAASSQTSSVSSQSQGTQQTVTFTVGSENDPIRNVEPEKVQQYIIEEPVIVVDPEPEATYVNDYENVDPEVKVDDSWFDDCVIMGDSLTVGLSMYNDAYNPFGKAKFVCASSLSYWNSQWDLYRPGNVHPYYNGRKVLLEDAAVLTGAKKAIITLGMNDIGIWGPEGTIEQARSLLNKIRAKSPDLQIYLETVTPMIYGRQKAHLNNELIRQFNSNLKNFAEQEGCGFLNSYDAFADSNGNLPYEFCSDPGGLGLHFNFQACAIWAEFLKANVGSLDPEPEPTEEPVTDTDTVTDTESNTESDIETDTDTTADVSSAAENE